MFDFASCCSLRLIDAGNCIDFIDHYFLIYAFLYAAIVLRDFIL